MSRREISIIIPTLADTARGPSLLRAIRSVQSDQPVAATPLVVVNGNRFDPAVVAAVRADPRVRLEQIAEPGLPTALRHGRGCVDTPFFGFLDDDDMLLPPALAERLAALRAEPAVDVVVGWGERVGDSLRERTPVAELIDPADPLRSLLRGNWLPSCAGLFRTDRVGPAYFDPEMRHLEWTSVALRLALDRTIRFLDNAAPHFTVFVTPGSLSLSRAYRFGVEHSLGKLLSLDLPRDVRRALAARRVGEWHFIAERCRQEGDLATAWRFRRRVLADRQGLAYLPALRHLLAATVRRALGR